MKKLRTQLTQLSRFILDISAKSIIELTWLPIYGIIYANSLYISIHGTGDSNGKGTAQPQLIPSDKVNGQKRTQPYTQQYL